jgi:hypothetical protein
VTADYDPGGVVPGKGDGLRHGAGVDCGPTGERDQRLGKSLFPPIDKLFFDEISDWCFADWGM